MFSLVTDTPPFLEEFPVGELNLTVWVVPCLCQPVRHVKVSTDLRNVSLEDQTPRAKVLRVALHAGDQPPGLLR